MSQFRLSKRDLQDGEHEFYLRVIVDDRVSDEAIIAALDDAPAEIYVMQAPEATVLGTTSWERHGDYDG